MSVYMSLKSGAKKSFGVPLKSFSMGALPIGSAFTPGHTAISGSFDMSNGRLVYPLLSRAVFGRATILRVEIVFTSPPLLSSALYLSNVLVTQFMFSANEEVRFGLDAATMKFDYGQNAKEAADRFREYKD